MVLVKHTAAVRQLFQRGAVIGNAGEAGSSKAKGAFFQIGFFTDPVYDKTLFLLHNCSYPLSFSLQVTWLISVFPKNVIAAIMKHGAETVSHLDVQIYAFQKEQDTMPAIPVKSAF